MEDPRLAIRGGDTTDDQGGFGADPLVSGCVRRPAYVDKDAEPYRTASGREFDDRRYAGTNTFPEPDPWTSFPTRRCSTRTSRNSRSRHGTWTLPEGGYEWKVAIDAEGIPLTIAKGGGSYRFTWNQVTHEPTAAKVGQPE